MGDYASKGVAGSGLGLGIAGTALALLNGNGLGGLFGNNKTDELQSKVAELTAEKYANQVAKEVYIAAAERDSKQNSRFEELVREIADIRVREAQVQGQIATNQAITNGAIASVASNANNGISVLTANLNTLATTVANITKTVVPKDVVCPEYMPRYNSWTAPTTPATTTSGS